MNLVSLLAGIAAGMRNSVTVQFAHDFYRQLKVYNVVPIGTEESNPWVQAFAGLENVPLEIR